jgi:hypothetical protein
MDRVRAIYREKPDGLMLLGPLTEVVWSWLRAVTALIPVAACDVGNHCRVFDGVPRAQQLLRARYGS